jgi:hypothetical protein
MSAGRLWHDQPQDDVENDPDALHKSEKNKSDPDPEGINVQARCQT